MTLLGATHPDLADQIKRERDILAVSRKTLYLTEREESLDLYGPEKARAAGASRTCARDVYVQSAKALLNSNPWIAHRLYAQAARLTKSHKLRVKIAAQAAAARERANRVRTAEAAAVKRAREAHNSSLTVEQTSCSKKGTSD